MVCIVTFRIGSRVETQMKNAKNVLDMLGWFFGQDGNNNPFVTFTMTSLSANDVA